VKGSEQDTYATCIINGDGIQLAQKIEIELDNFKPEKIKIIKQLIENYYPKNSEKGIQGAYATHWKRHSKNTEKHGYFIDTKFVLTDEKSRIDLVFMYYKDPERPRLYFVELKTQSDPRLFEYKDDKVSIDKQLKKYCDLIKKYHDRLKDYYITLYKIKRELDLMPEEAKKINIDNLNIELKPILLIGDATIEFISVYEKKLDVKIKENCCMRIYRGVATNHLNFDEHGIKNVYPSRKI